MNQPGRGGMQERIGAMAGRIQYGFALILLAAGWFSVAISQIALGAALLALLVRWIGGRRAPVRTGLELSGALLAGWALITIPFSHDPHLSLLYYKRFFLVAAIWTTASCATSERRRLGMLLAAGIGALGTSLFHQIVPLLTGEKLFHARLEGFFNAMTTGLVLMLGASLAIGFMIVPRVGRRWRLVALLAALSLVVALAQTFTRSAILGFLVGLVVMLLLVRPRVFVPLLLAVVLTVSIAWGPLMKALPDRLARRFDPAALTTAKSPQARLEMWRGGWVMVQAHPVTGVGDVGLTEISPQYYGDEDTPYWGHLHSNPVQMAVIWGVPGLVLGTWFLLAPGWILVRRWRILARGRHGRRFSPVQAGWVLGILGAWAGFNLAGLTEWYFGDAESLLMYMGLLGCALGPMHESTNVCAAPAGGHEETDAREE